jgi:hypothetical protein
MKETIEEICRTLKSTEALMVVSEVIGRQRYQDGLALEPMQLSGKHTSNKTKNTINGKRSFTGGIRAVSRF